MATKSEVEYWIKVAFIIAFAVITLLLSITVMAYDYQYPSVVIEPTTPGTNLPDYSIPAWVQRGNMIYQTTPGTHLPDFSKPGYRIRQRYETPPLIPLPPYPMSPR